MITRDDLLKQFAPKGDKVTEDQIQKVWSEIVLKPEVKVSLLGMIRMFNSGDKLAAKGLLLYGPPGTGKTEIARKLAKSTGCKFLEVKPSDLKAGYVGQSGKQVKAVWDKARSFGRCVIFVDECDAVFGRRGGVDTDAFADDVVTSFLPEWDGAGSTGQIWVVGATNRRDRFDDAIIDRLRDADRDRPARCGAAHRDPPARNTEARARRRRARVRRARNHRLRWPQARRAREEGLPGWRRARRRERRGVARGHRRFGEGDELSGRRERELGLADSPGADDPAAQVDLLDGEARRDARAQHIDVPRAALLFGPPGTGKTQIARTLANESGLGFIAAGPSDLKAGFTGQSGQLVRTLFERARGSAPCILFIDEIESGAASRDGGETDQFTGEIVNELLTQMDGAKKKTGDVFVLAATNHPKLVDAAVLSRFEERIEIPNPGLDERRRMIATFIGKRRVDFDVASAAEELATRAKA